MEISGELHALVRRRWRIAAALSVAVVVVYFGFILLIAFDRPLMSTKLTDGLSVGILLGAFVIVAAWLLTYVYVRWSNKHFDDAVRRSGGGKQP